MKVLSLYLKEMYKTKQQPIKQKVYKTINSFKDYEKFLADYVNLDEVNIREMSTWISNLTMDNTTFLRQKKETTLPLNLDDINFLVRGGELVFNKANKEYHVIMSDLGYSPIANLTFLFYLKPLYENN